MKHEKSPLNKDLRPILIYDGDCAFCSSSVRFLQRALKKAPSMEPYQFLKLDAYGISAAQCREEAKFVSSDGTVTGGHMAFAELFKGSGRLWWVLGSTLSLPGLRSFAGVVYRWVAKNRYRLPGGTPTCAMNKSET